jgi:recombinational DNA repair ATPase RecF
MSKELLREFYLIVESTHMKAIEEESEILDMSWLDVLGARLNKIDGLIQEPLFRRYFFPSELKKMEKKLFAAKRMYIKVIYGRNSVLEDPHKNTKRKLCRIRSLISFVSLK